MLTTDQRERLLDLLLDEEREVQTQGLELVAALSPRERCGIAGSLVRASGPPRWDLAARCLLPARRADRRLRLFAARCALYRLERERAAGREPDEEAWRAVEMAEQYAAGALRERERRRMAKRLEAWSLDWEWEYAGSWGVSQEGVDLEAVPGGERWEDAWELGVGIAASAEVLVGDAAFEEELEVMYRAHHAAAMAMTWPERDEDSWPCSFIPEAMSREERGVQRRLWRAVVVRGEDGVAEVFGHAGSEASVAAGRSGVGRDTHTLEVCDHAGSSMGAGSPPMSLRSG